MKNMSDKTKKWLLIAGGLALSAVLVVAIAGQFQTEKPTDALLPSQSTSVSDVTVDPNALDNTEKEKDIVTTTSDVTQPASSDNGAVDKGTEQTIQGDVTKPEYTEEELKNPNQKPNGDPVTENDKVQDHDKVETPVPPSAQSKPSGGGNSIPGFDNVPDGGANQVIEVDGDGDINKQVGTMD